MECLYGYRMRSTLVSVVTAIILCSGNVRGDFAFGEPTRLEVPVNSTDWTSHPHISRDGLTLFFVSTRPGSLGGYPDIWVTRRPSKEDSWPEPENLGAPVNTVDYEWSPYVSADGSELYFHSNRPGGYGGMDLWAASRERSEQTPEGYWSVPTNLGPTVNSAYLDGSPYITDDGLEFFFTSDRPGGQGDYDIWMMRRETTEDPWGEPVNLGPTINSASRDRVGCVSLDGLVFFFDSERPEGYGESAIWMSKRPTALGDWGPPVNLGASVNASYEGNQSISADGLTLYFSGKRPGALGSPNLWQALLIPIVDFNGNGPADIKDLTKLIEHWGQNDPAYDMGPMPWGDGVVDAADLEILMSHWEKEVDDPTLMANWKLDEIEGDVAYDSAAENDAIVMGDAIWQPDQGQVSGALELDGMDDYIDASCILNPEEGVFSVFAWVRGGAPGQVIISQENGADWLMTNAQGCLMTDLESGGRRSGGPLTSETIVTDGNWHRVGFVWDGSNRILYVDDVAVIEDTLPELVEASGGLRIGVSSNLDAGSFWAGMIDDVRIYSRVVVP
jgi:hypothetical protein